MKDEKQVGRYKQVAGVLSALLLVAIMVYVAAPAFEKSEPVLARPEATAAAQREDPLEKFRAERKQTREEEIRQINALLDDESVDEQIRVQAQGQLLNLTNWMEQEVTIEGVLRARGYQDPLATVHEDSVNVIVRSDALTQSDSARILELVTRETGQTGGNVKIIPIN